MFQFPCHVGAGNVPKPDAGLQSHELKVQTQSRASVTVPPPPCYLPPTCRMYPPQHAPPPPICPCLFLVASFLACTCSNGCFSSPPCRLSPPPPSPPLLGTRLPCMGDRHVLQQVCQLLHMGDGHPAVTALPPHTVGGVDVATDNQACMACARARAWEGGGWGVGADPAE